MTNYMLEALKLAKLAFCNSKKLPQYINDNSVRKHWIGIGCIDCKEKPKRTDPILVEEEK